MKKNDFENRLQNDLFPDMPRSFERKMKQALENEGVQRKKRPSATDVFTGAISVLAAAACLAIVLMGVLGGGNSKTNAAASAETAVATEAPQHTPKSAPRWNWDTKVITLSTGFEFENQEKFEALYKGILRFLMIQGETEPDELWLCAIKSRYVKEDTGIRADGYLSGYYVLAQHAFGEKDGPELYCLSDDFEVLWATEDSAPGPNHAVNPAGDSYAAIYQGHILYGTEPFIAEPGIPHVKRGALVGAEPGTNIEFSMRSSITEVQNRLSAAGSAHIGCAREYFLVTVPASSWDSVMKNPILRFETEEGPVDVNMETELPEAKVVMGPQPSSDTENVERQGVEYWLSQNQPIITDLTDDWYGPEAVAYYAQAVVRALRVGGEHIASEGIWICGVLFDIEKEDGSLPDTAYILAQYTFDGNPGPELFYYNHGAIEWMTRGCDSERINVVYHNGNTIVFGRSPAYDNGPLAMEQAILNVKDRAIYPFTPQLPLDKIQQRIIGGPNYDAARECYLWMEDEGEFEVQELTVTASKDGRIRRFTVNKVNVLDPQPVPAMALEIGGLVYPGTVTHFYQSLNADGIVAEGAPIEETLEGTTFETVQMDQATLDNVSWQVITSSDKVSVNGVDIYSDACEKLYNNAEISAINGLDPGTYYLCFRTTIKYAYSMSLGGYIYITVYFIYKVTMN